MTLASSRDNVFTFVIGYTKAIITPAVFFSQFKGSPWLQAALLCIFHPERLSTESIERTSVAPDTADFRLIIIDMTKERFKVVG
jgi:hypothetical protein